jgi:RNA polymerase sigma factor (sigma-70 family)
MSDGRRGINLSGSHSQTIQPLRDIETSVDVEEALKGLDSNEKRIIVLVAAGMSNKEIGAELGISCQDVQDRRSEIMGKLRYFMNFTD